MIVRIVGGHGGVSSGFRATSYLIDGKLLIDAGAVASGMTIDEQVLIDNIFFGSSIFAFDVEAHNPMFVRIYSLFYVYFFLIFPTKFLKKFDDQCKIFYFFVYSYSFIPKFHVCKFYFKT